MGVELVLGKRKNERKKKKLTPEHIADDVQP